MRVICIGWTQVMSDINYLESDEGNTAFVVSNISYSQFGTMCVYDEHCLVTENCYLLSQIVGIKFFFC